VGHSFYVLLDEKTSAIKKSAKSAPNNFLLIGRLLALEPAGRVAATTRFWRKTMNKETQENPTSNQILDLELDLTVLDTSYSFGESRNEP
jgi:hypothetical protein